MNVLVGVFVDWEVLGREIAEEDVDIFAGVDRRGVEVLLVDGIEDVAAMELAGVVFDDDVAGFFAAELSVDEFGLLVPVFVLESVLRWYFTGSSRLQDLCQFSIAACLVSSISLRIWR